MKRKALFLLAVLVSTTLTSNIIDANAQTNQSEQATPADEMALLRSLAERFTGVNSVPDSELFIGELPDTFPGELLPMPEGSQLLASVVRHNDFLEVYIDSARSADEVKAFYKEQLFGAGWKAGTFPVGWGISAATATAETPEMDLPLIFCSPAEDFMVQLTAWEVELTGLTDIRLSILLDQSVVRSSACESLVEFSFLPTLQLPTGADISTSHSGYEDNFVHTDVVVSTPMTSEELLSHLSEQFEQAGWTLVDQTNDDVLSWSSWTVDNAQGEAWQGTLNVVQLRGVTDEYLIRAQAKKSELE